MSSLALGSRVRVLLATVLTALLVATGLAAGALPATAAAGDVAAATLQWGVKESFRSYIAGPIAHGGWALSGGVTDSPAFSWSSGTGGYDAAAGTGTVSYPGSIRFTGHEMPAGSGSFVLDVTIANVRIAKTGATTAQLIVDGTSSGTSYPNAVFAELNLAGAGASTEGATVSYTAAPATLTATGSQILQGFYAAGSALDPVTFSWPVEQAPVAATTTTTLGVTPNPATAGQNVTLTATVTPAAAGTVQFRDGATALGAPVAVASGTATLATTAFAAGTHSLTAEFVSSDAGYSGSTSAAATLAVTAAPTTPAVDGLAWGISTYLNSANMGRPNPAPAAYTAPASFDATNRISTWGEDSIVSNGDGTVTVSFDGASVNHAKTGGGWLRLADLEATLDASGNGTVSAVVSYGTMAPPAVFDPSQAPLRGPTRVNVLTLGGNAVAPVASGEGATWSGLIALWHADFTGFLAGDGAGVAAWAYASTVTNTTAGREPSPLNLTLSELPDFSVPSNEAVWGISGYLNSAAMGRPNPAPAAYTAPATFDSDTRLSTWGDGTVTTNDDGTVTLSFEGATVNHAKTGGGWLRLADLVATLDEDGNGTVSAEVSYGTMAPPAVFDPAQAPARGPERIDIVQLTGNSTAPVASGSGASWNGLTGVWHDELLAFLAGDAAATPAIAGWQYKSTVTNTGADDRKPSPLSFALLEVPEFEGEPGGGDPGTGPGEPGPGTPVATPGTLRWGVKSQFRDYVLGPIAHGSIAVGGGAGTAGPEFSFPQSSASLDGSGLGTVGFRGSVRFTGHAGALSVVVADPIVTITSASSASLSVVTASGRVDFARLDLAGGTRAVDATGAVSYTGAPATLTSAGAVGFAGFYTAGEALSPVSFTVGSDNSANLGGGTVRGALASTANTPDATPPATEGIELEGDGEVREGDEITVTASGFQPNESGILVVIYSEPILLADDAQADADGEVSWTGRLPAGLTGSHTLTFQGSVDRGIVLDIAAAEQVGCPVESATLSWGFKESFRAYVTGLAQGDWQLSGGASYETPEFRWTEPAGSWDGESTAGLAFAGAVRFTGHEGVLDTTIANPRLVLDGHSGSLMLDVSGTTRDGQAVSATGIEFAELDLTAGERVDDGGAVRISGIPAVLTAGGAAAFGSTYQAGEALDPVTIELVGGGDCVQPVAMAPLDASADEPEVVAAVNPIGWWLLGSALLLALIVLAIVLILRRRTA